MSDGKIELTYPDGSKHEFPAGTTGFDVAASIGKRLAQDAVGVKIDGVLTDLNRPIHKNGSFAVVTPKSRDGKLDADGLWLLRHTAEHVMTEAICKLWPQTKLVYGPPVEDGFYGDIDLDYKISVADFPKIEEEMKKIVAENRPMTRYELPRAEGLAKLKAEGNEYKVDNAERADGDLSFYITGSEQGKNFEDLCMGPHIPNTGKIGAFKLTAVSGSYYRGDENNKQLQRIYGVAFPSQKDLDEHIRLVEEAKKRDHRVIGKQMGLFTLTPAVGQGLVLWMPKGGIIRTELQNLMQGELMKRGYSPVFTPHIGSIELYKTSGHFPYYKDSQYPTIKTVEADGKPGEEYLLKPMNCPHHCQIYAAQMHSYRDLPVRLAEFGTVYRYEQSGELNGMTRVRGLTQDDAHLFCTAEQVEGEFQSTVGLVQDIFGYLGLKEYRVQVSVREPGSDKYTGDPAKWSHAEETLKRVAKDMKLPHEVAEGEAAFYGPKLDFMVKDCIGREWQLGTVQLDYNLPERFKLEYVASDNTRQRPVMIHRAPFGSFERFVGILIEHFAGAFPLWLSPVQILIAPITDNQIEPCQRISAELRKEGFRVAEDLAYRKIGAKATDFDNAKIPYMIVLGEREVAEGKVAVRARGTRNLVAMPVADFIEQVKKERAERRTS
jgi:threonyl-tRNA synthetase